MRRLFRLGIGADPEREVDDELAFHLEMRTQQLIAQGLSPDQAREAAMRQFGDLSYVRDSCVTHDVERERTMRRANLFDELRQDIVFALRMLRRNRGVTAVVILSLALGIGANTAMFTLVNAVLLRTLPVRRPDQLVALGDPARTNSLSSGSQRADLFSYPLYRDLRDGQHLFSGLAASGRTERLDIQVGDARGAVEHAAGRFVSGNYFGVLGVGAAAGRVFDGSEDRAIGASPVAVISDGYWTRRFNRDPGAVNRDMVIDGVRFTIIGITPPSFTGEIVGQDYDIWLPVTMEALLQPNEAALDKRSESWLLLLGRVADGVTLAQAEGALPAMIRTLMVEHAVDPSVVPQLRTGPVWISDGARGFSRVRKTYRTPLLTLMIGVGLLMLIICANVANLLLARAMARTREMGVRLAIGAGRARLVRQLLTESLVLAVASAAAGLAIAWWGSRALLLLVADGGRVVPIHMQLDVPVLAFTMATTIFAVALFGLAPALRSSRVDLATAMRASAKSVTGGDMGTRGQRVPLGRLLVAGQVGLSLVLLVGAALLVRSLQSVQQADTGLDRDHLLIVDVDALGRGYHDARLLALLGELTGRLSRIPGVAAVSYSANGIFSGTDSQTSIGIAGFEARTPDDSSAAYDDVGPGYFHALGTRVLQGRDFTTDDALHTLPVAIVNATMARFYFGESNPIGKIIRIPRGGSTLTIVGVVADTRDHDLTAAPDRRFYLAYPQLTRGEPGSLRFEVRAHGDPALLMNAVRRAVTEQDAQLALDGLDPLSWLMRQSVREERLLSRLATGFGVLALVLAGIGLYGVMTYAIVRRTAEIGLRVALGAQRGNVIGMVLGDALNLVSLGLIIGVPLSFASTRLLRAQLHGVEATDPASLIAALTVLSVSALVAALLPALRAARVPPLQALRDD